MRHPKRPTTNPRGTPMTTPTGCRSSAVTNRCAALAPVATRSHATCRTRRGVDGSASRACGTAPRARARRGLRPTGRGGVRAPRGSRGRRGASGTCELDVAREGGRRPRPRRPVAVAHCGAGEGLGERDAFELVRRSPRHRWRTGRWCGRARCRCPPRRAVPADPLGEDRDPGADGLVQLRASRAPSTISPSRSGM